MKKAAIALCIALATTSVGIASAAPKAIDDQQQVQNDKQREARLMMSVKDANEILKQQGINKQVTAHDIPTKDEVNAKLKGLQVTKDHPKEVVNLGNGHQVILEVGVMQQAQSPKTTSKPGVITPQYSFSQTAYGKITYVFAGVNVADLIVTDNYTYDDGSAQILSYQDPPSVSAPTHWPGWSGTVTGRYVYSIDSTVKDAIGDSSYSTTTGGNVAGHLEVRFTGAGNYYSHDYYFQ